MREKYIRVFEEYLEDYFIKRDINKILEYVDENTTGFGTGGDESAFPGEFGETGNGKLIELYKRDLLSAPNSVSYVLHEIGVTELTEKSAIVMAKMDISTEIFQQEVRLNDLRMSIAFVETDLRFLIKNIHVSFPSEVHEDGEAYPLKELEERMQVIDRILKERTKTLHEAYGELLRMVNTDKLTEVSSRVHLDESLEAEIQRFNRYGSVFTVVFFDIDRFKELNDSFGHDFGDLVLKSVAKAAADCSRETDVVGRWGGDEFFVILPESSLSRTKSYVKKVANVINAIRLRSDLIISASFGIATVAHGDTAESLFKRADQNMYLSKNTGERKY